MNSLRQPIIRANARQEAEQAVAVSHNIPDLMTHATLGENIGKINVFLNGEGRTLSSANKQVFEGARKTLTARLDMFKKPRVYKPGTQRWYEAEAA